VVQSAYPRSTNLEEVFGVPNEKELKLLAKKDEGFLGSEITFDIA
jgi:hypothetical protein